MAQNNSIKTINEIFNDVYINNNSDEEKSTLNVVVANNVSEQITHTQATYELLNNIEDNGAIRIVIV